MFRIPVPATATELIGRTYSFRETGDRGGWRPFRTVLAIFSILCAFHATPSFATAIYLARATASLEILSITGGNATDLVIGGLFLPPDTSSDQFADGNSSAAKSGFANVTGADPNNLVVGDGLDLKAEASGSASPTGSSDSFFDSFASVDLFNDSNTDTFTVSFRFTWALLADASVSNFNTDDAVAVAGIELETSSDGILLAEYPVSDALFGPFGPQSLSDTLEFSLLVLPGGSEFVDIFASANGFAESIPEPSTWALLAIGLMTWAGLRASRRSGDARA